MLKLLIRLLPDSFKNRFFVLFVIFAVLAGITSVTVQYNYDKKSFHKYAFETVDNIHKSAESRFRDAILFDDIYTLFSMAESIARSVSVVRNVYILDSKEAYITDSSVSNRLPPPSRINQKYILQLENGKTVGFVIYTIDSESINKAALTHSVTNLVFIIPIVVFFIFLSLKLILFFTKPLDIISCSLKKMDIHNLPMVFNLPDYTSVELRNLADVFTSISSELDRNIKRNIEQEKMLAKEERLAAIGSMSAGLAHELRNPVMSLQMMMHSVKESNNIITSEDVNVMSREISRISATVNEFLSMAKPIDIHPEKTGTLAVKNMVTEQIQRIMKGSLTVEFRGDDFEFVSDPIMIFNIIENLLRNSYEAGATRCVIEFSKAADEVTLIFEDNGSGIPEQYRDKIFRPFFTTKKSGTGLGMSMCEKMASALGGWIALDGNSGKVAKFIIKIKDMK